MDKLFEMQGFLKAVFLIVTFPIWGKIARAMWTEIQRGLASDGGVFGGAEIDASPRPPGLDPFLNIPLADYRRRKMQADAHRETAAAEAEEASSSKKPKRPAAHRTRF